MNTTAGDKRATVLMRLGAGLIGTAVIGAIYFIYVESGVGDAVSPLAWLLAIAFVVTLVIPFVVEPAVDVFSPVVFHMLLKTQWIGKPLIELALGSYTNSQLPQLTRQQALELLVASLGVLVTGHVAYLLGYYSRSYRHLPSLQTYLPSDYRPSRVRTVVIVLLVALGVSYAMIVREAGSFKAMWDQLGMRSELYSDARLYLAPLAYYALPFLLLALPSIRAGRLPKWFPIAVLGGAFLTAATGDRSRVLTPILVVIMVLHYLYKRISFWKLGVIGLFLITVAVGIQDLRRMTVSGGGLDVSALRQTSIGSPQVVEDFFLRRRTIDLVGTMLYLMPDDLPFQYGRTYLNALVMPIPRSIWPDKPIVDESGIVGYALMGPNYYGLPVGTEGVLYMNFHIPGVILGCFLLGVIHRRMYETLITSNRNPSVVLMYATALPTIMYLTGINLFKTFLVAFPVLLLVWFMRSSREGPSLDATPGRDKLGFVSR